MDIRLKRAYEPAVPADGCRILIDRLWPRGVSHHEAKLDDWDKALSQRRRRPRGGSPTRPAEGSKVTSRASRPRVLIAGGGVAGLETLLALHALAADRLEVAILAPELKFV